MDAETIVIGAGVVGLTMARNLAANGHDVLVIEEAEGIGRQTSSRNSEVIHAGIYYPTGSLKARTCVAGCKALYDYCASRGVPAKRIGKLILATTEDEVSALTKLYARAVQNGVCNLAWLDHAAVREMEPEVTCVAALYSPSSGIVDSHAYMLALQGDAENAGTVFAFRAKVVGLTPTSDGYRVSIGGEAEMLLTCRNVVNCAGHGAHAIARATKGYPVDMTPPRFLAKGNYFTVSGATPFNHLVYPMPVRGGLGIHMTLDLSGRMRLGPDLRWVEHLDYTPEPAVAEQFRVAVATYWPEVMYRELSWTYSGVRPKLSGPGSENADFMVIGPEDHGLQGLVHFFGIESPGLTSSLALADLGTVKLEWR